MSPQTSLRAGRASLALVALIVVGALAAYFVFESESTRAERSSLPAQPQETADGEAGRSGIVEATIARTGAGREVATLGSSEVGASLAAAAAEEDLTISTAPEDWRTLLDRIRSAAGLRDPHRAAWPSVQALADLAEGAPDSIARELDDLLRDPQSEGPFVRGALLLTLGLAYSKDQARSLAGEFLGEQPGELVRAAWLVVALASRGDDGKSVDLNGFEVTDSRARRSIWPVTIPVARDDAALGLALDRLLPAELYGREALSRGTVTEREAEEGVLTRETIVLALFAGRAGTPGAARDWLMDWAIGTDMRNACIWSLCLAARDDPELALALRNLGSRVGISLLSEGNLIAELLSRLAGRGDLVFDMLAAELGMSGTDGDVIASMTKLAAMSSLGEIIEAGDSELAELATRLLIETSVDPGRGDDVRKLTLIQISVSNPTRAGEAIGPVLIGPGGGELKKRAAAVARLVPAESQQGMRDALMRGYSDDLPGDVKQSYLRSLMSLDGDDSRAFLSTLLGSEDLGEEFNQNLADYLSE